MKRNQFGGTIGGPIKAGQAILFPGLSGHAASIAPAAVAAVLPTAAELTGDFTAYEANCFATPQTLKGPLYVGNKLTTPVSPQALAFASHFE